MILGGSDHYRNHNNVPFIYVLILYLQGATAGCVVSLVLTFWVAAGSVVTGAGERTMNILPLSRAECPGNLSSIPIPIPPQQPDRSDNLLLIYTLLQMLLRFDLYNTDIAKFLFNNILCIVATVLVPLRISTGCPTCGTHCLPVLSLG